MTGVTLRVLDGADRGRIYPDLPTPVTIGREEGNKIQLNDERVSRYHVKIVEDQGTLVLTDLESTNGTKVNGEDIKIRILRHGDLITLGKSVLVFGTREQIARRMALLRGEAIEEDDGALTLDQFNRAQGAASFNFEVNWSDPAFSQALADEPPRIPRGLTPGQVAELAEFLGYLNLRLRGLISSVQVTERKPTVSLDMRQWQNLVDMQSRIAEFLRDLTDPREES